MKGAGILQTLGQVLGGDGTGYPGNPTVPPAEPVSNLGGTEILIAEFKSYKDGKPVPPPSR